MTQYLLQTYLERETKFRSALDEARARRSSAEDRLLEAEGSIHAVSRLVPFLGKEAKMTAESAKTALVKKRREEETAETDLAEVREHLDALMLDKLRREQNPDLKQSEAMLDLFCALQRRIEIFNERVADFRKSLGQARAAMSAGYDRTHKRYSGAAMERVGEAVQFAHKLDSALDEVNQRVQQFQAKARGTPYARLEVPKLEPKGYATFVRHTIDQPIGQAQHAFEKMLGACEQLNDEGVGLVFQQLEAARAEHTLITQDIVRRAWQREQEALRASKEAPEPTSGQPAAVTHGAYR